MLRTAKHSREYIAALSGKPKPSKQDKIAILGSLVASMQAGDNGAFNKIGQGMVGPIMMRLRYEGICRTVITEDPLAAGQQPVYEVLDQLGKAYFLEEWHAEVKATEFEGKRVQYPFFRIASFPTIMKSDLYELNIDMVERAQDESRQQIMREEDSHLIGLLSVVVDSIDGTHKDFAGLSSHVTTFNGDFLPEVFYNASKIPIQNELQSKNIIANPVDTRAMYTWSITVQGLSMKDEVVDGQKIRSFGEFNLLESVRVPQGEMYLTPEADYLGRMPFRYSLEVEENNKVEAFTKGWVMDEVLNMLILNKNGVVRIEL